MLAFPTDLAAIVGQQVTLNAINAPVANPRINLLRTRAQAAFSSLILGGTSTECDLIVKGNVSGEARGWLMQSGGDYQDDMGNTIGDTALRALANTDGPLTFTCVVPGSGQRMALDRDSDATLDGNDNCPADNNPTQANFDSDSHLINLGYGGIEGLTLTGFAYLLDFGNGAGASSETYGARAAYKTALSGDWSLKGAASYARQSEYGSNPASFSLDYYSVDAGASYGPLSFGAGYEVLEGDGTTGFSTPLATLHKFQGWADAFLTTPVDGIEDLSASLNYALPAFGPFTKITSGIVFHDFEAERTGASLGDEVDAVLSAALDNGIKLTAKYASFDGGSAGPADREKLWFQVAYAY